MDCLLTCIPNYFQVQLHAVYYKYPGGGLCFSCVWNHRLFINVSEVLLQRLKVSFVVVAKLLYWNRMIRVKSSSD